MVASARRDWRMLQNSSEVETVIAMLSASALIGTEVQNRYGEDLGKLEGLTIDRQRGCVAYAVLSSGGLLGLGEKLFAMPWQAMRFDTENERVVVDIEREALENAPGFDEDHRPGTIDDAWLRELYIYYGHTPYWEGFNSTPGS
jgi:sporulation protein YlmC with PRC-barrel domain